MNEQSSSVGIMKTHVALNNIHEPPRYIIETRRDSSLWFALLHCSVAGRAAAAPVTWITLSTDTCAAKDSPILRPPSPCGVLAAVPPRHPASPLPCAYVMRPNQTLLHYSPSLLRPRRPGRHCSTPEATEGHRDRSGQRREKATLVCVTVVIVEIVTQQTDRPPCER